MRKCLASLFIVLVFFVSIVTTASASSKSFFFPDVSIDMIVQQDGSINVVEKRTFDFKGSFSKVYWDIPLSKNQTISDIAVSEGDINYVQLPYADDINRPENNFSVENLGNTVHIEAYHRSFDEAKIFILSYKLHGVISKYQDVAELYWKIIGEEWGAKTDKVTVTVTLPQEVDKNKISVWGHGPLNGQATILDGKTVKFTVANVPVKTFVEIRTLFPTEIIQGETINENALLRIQNEEIRFQRQTVIKQQAKIGVLMFLVIGLIFWIVYWYRIWVKKGKEYKTTIVPEYIYFPPSSIPPALVEAMINQEENISTNSFSATVLYLAKNGLIKLEAQPYYTKGILGLGSHLDYHYILHFLADKNELMRLNRSERMVYEFLDEMAKDNQLSIDEMKKIINAHKSSSYNFLQDWKKTVKEEADGLNFVDDESKKIRTSFVVFNTIILVAALIIFALIFNFASSESFIFIIVWSAIFGSIFMTFIGRVFLRWNKNIKVEVDKWLAFKNYIVNFSRFKRELPQAVVIWEDILIYATAFGIAEKVIEYLPIILKHKEAVTPSWYYISGSGSTKGELSSAAMGMNVSFATQFQDSFSSLSTAFNTSFSSGSGGGFSGGGGGGGGGVGGGAN